MTSTRICRRITLAVVALSGALLLPSIAATAAPEGGTDIRTGASARIDRWIGDHVADRDVPGVAVAVVRGGRVVHPAGYGVTDDTGRPVTPDTPFLLGSVSKPFTAVVVGQLVEEGVLAWDEPVWPHLAHLVDEAPDGFDAVTVEQLLTYTGGLGMFVGVAGEVTVHRRPGAAGWIRSVLPGAVYLATGLALLAAPLGMARHFHPDVGWALTIGAGLAIVLGVMRLALTVRDGFQRPTRST